MNEDVPVQDQAEQRGDRRAVRRKLQATALQNALRKRELGVPSYTVPEAAALLSLSQEYLYRLVHADSFPSLRMRHGRGTGRFVVPAKAVEAMLDSASHAGNLIDVADWTQAWRASTTGGAA